MNSPLSDPGLFHLTCIRFAKDVEAWQRVLLSGSTMPKGLVCPEGGGEDIFAHYSTIQMDGYRTLKAGQSVQFDVHQGPKGNHASVIVPVEVEAAVA